MKGSQVNHSNFINGVGCYRLLSYDVYLQMCDNLIFVLKFGEHPLC